MNKHQHFVIVAKKELKKVTRFPTLVQTKLQRLLEDLRDDGPILKNWPNFSKLGKDKYHCHLSRSWVACWRSKNNKLLIEVYYVGSREKAPY